MSNGPMVSAALLVKIKRERDLLWWVLLAMLAAHQKPRPPKTTRQMFDWRKLQAGDS